MLMDDDTWASVVGLDHGSDNSSEDSDHSGSQHRLELPKLSKYQELAVIDTQTRRRNGNANAKRTKCKNTSKMFVKDKQVEIDAEDFKRSIESYQDTLNVEPEKIGFTLKQIKSAKRPVEALLRTTCREYPKALAAYFSPSIPANVDATNDFDVCVGDIQEDLDRQKHKIQVFRDSKNIAKQSDRFDEDEGMPPIDVMDNCKHQDTELPPASMLSRIDVSFRPKVRRCTFTYSQRKKTKRDGDELPEDILEDEDNSIL